MTILNVVKYPDQLLHKKSESVKDFDSRLKKIVSNMYETMHHYDGIGLAAIQVGIPEKIIVIDIDNEEQQFKSEIINPKILSFSLQESSMSEGCLSVQNKIYEVVRPNEVCVEYFTLDGKKHKIEANGLLAKCLQHEIDHTNGITIVDRGIEKQTDDK